MFLSVGFPSMIVGTVKPMLKNEQLPEVNGTAVILYVSQSRNYLAPDHAKEDQTISVCNLRQNMQAIAFTKVINTLGQVMSFTR